MPDHDALVKALLERYPQSRADELGIDCSRNTPQPLYQWLVCSLLMASRISTDIAVRSAKALFDADWDMPERMLNAGWEARMKVLNEAGYAHYDNVTSNYLGDTCQHLVDAYGGDLRKLREAVDGDLSAMRERLKNFKGIGDVGTDIFCAEAQRAWDELYPFVDARTGEIAAGLGLPKEADALADVTGRENLPRVISALVQMDSDGMQGDVRKAAAG